MKSSYRLRARLLSLLLCAAPVLAQDWSAPTAELAKAIVGATGPGTISLSVTNSSSLPQDQALQLQRTIEAQLLAAKVRVATSREREVRVTLSENLTGYVWVAEIHQGADTQVHMITVARPQPMVSAQNTPRVTIRKLLLWSQPSEMLDLRLLDTNTSSPRMVVLDKDALSVYSSQQGKWQRDQTWAIAHSRPFPRDPRGHLVEEKDHSITAYLPGTVCNASTSSIVCRDSDDAWEIGPYAAFFNSARNYFTGALVPATSIAVGPFFSLAWLPASTPSMVVWTAVDGSVHMTSGANPAVPSPMATADWGSDLAAAASRCSAGAQLLVSSATDDNSTDSLRAYEITERGPVLASTATTFPGPIMAMWSQDATTVTTIVRNLQTGRYEAYGVSIICNQ